MSDAEVISFGQDSNVEEALERKMSDEKEDVMASSKGNEFIYFFLLSQSFTFTFTLNVYFRFQLLFRGDRLISFSLM